MHSNQQLWRNPYPAKRRRTPTTTQRQKPASAPVRTPQVPTKQDTRQAKHSLLTIRNQVRGFREQVEQMEKTMDTLFTVMEAIDKLGTPSSVKGSGSQSNLLKSFQNIDFKQVMSFLQSPLVQALVETMAEEEPKQKK